MWARPRAINPSLSTMRMVIGVRMPYRGLTRRMAKHDGGLEDLYGQTG